MEIDVSEAQVINDPHIQDEYARVRVFHKPLGSPYLMDIYVSSDDGQTWKRMMTYGQQLSSGPGQKPTPVLSIGIPVALIEDCG